MHSLNTVEFADSLLLVRLWSRYGAYGLVRAMHLYLPRTEPVLAMSTLQARPSSSRRAFGAGVCVVVPYTPCDPDTYVRCVQPILDGAPGYIAGRQAKVRVCALASSCTDLPVNLASILLFAPLIIAHTRSSRSHASEP